LGYEGREFLKGVLWSVTIHAPNTIQFLPVNFPLLLTAIFATFLQRPDRFYRPLPASKPDLTKCLPDITHRPLLQPVSGKVE